MKTLLIFLTIVRGADDASSIYAFKAGAVERNPFVISTKTTPFLVETSLATVGEVWLFHHIHKSHPKLANTLIVAGMVAGAAATVNNISVGRELRR